MRDEQLDKFMESCEFNLEGEFIDTESQKRAVELFKKQLDQETKSTSIWSFIKEKASFIIVDHSPLKIFRIFRNKEKEFEKKQQQLLSKTRINTDVKMEEIEKLMTRWTRNEKLNGINNLRKQLNGKILFDYIKLNKFCEIMFCKKYLSSNDMQTQAYADSVLKIIDTVSKFDAFSKDNKELKENLNQFNDIFKNHSWSMQHKREIESWIAGSEKTVFAKMMNAN